MRIGPVLEVTTSFQNKYGIEIQISSVGQDNSQSWVRILHETIKHVIDSNQNNIEIPADPHEDQTSQTSVKVVACRSKAKAKPQKRELVDTLSIMPMHERKWIDIDPSEPTAKCDRAVWARSIMVAAAKGRQHLLADLAKFYEHLHDHLWRRPPQLPHSCWPLLQTVSTLLPSYRFWNVVDDISGHVVGSRRRSRHSQPRQPRSWWRASRRATYRPWRASPRFSSTAWTNSSTGFFGNWMRKASGSFVGKGHTLAI